MGKKNKEDAYSDFMNMIIRSWTWGKMSVKERCRFVDAICQYDIKGSYEQRHMCYRLCYSLYLKGLGYDGATWRATKAEPEEMPLF